MLGLVILQLAVGDMFASENGEWEKIESPELLINSFLISDETKHIDLDPYMFLLVDSTGELSFEEIISRAHLFGPVKPDEIDGHGPYQHKYWLYFKVCSEVDKSDWYLGFVYPEVRFFRSVNEGVWETGLYGYNVRNRTNSVRFGPDLFFPISLKADQCHEYILQCSPRIVGDVGHGRMKDTHRKLNNRSRIHQLQKAQAFKSLPLISILFTIFFYHFILFLYNRETTFLYLSIFSLAECALIANNAGYFIQLFDVENIGTNIKTVSALCFTALTIAAPFTVSYLSLPKDSHLSTVAKLLGWFCFGTGMFGVLAGLLPHHTYLMLQSFGRDLYVISQFLFHPGFLYIGFVSLYLKNGKAKYYLLGYGVWFVGTFITNSVSIGIFEGTGTPLRFGVYELSNLGATFGMLFFSFGLARQFKTLKEDRIAAENAKILSEKMRDFEKREAQRLKEIDQFKSQLYTNITHEFRTPLTVISGIANQLPDDSGDKQLIRRNADQLLDLVNQMLDLSKLDAGKLEVNWIQMDLIPFIKYLGEGYSHRISGRKKHFQLELTEDVLWMDTDPKFLTRILGNLIDNAFKFSPDGSIIRMRTEKTNNVCKIQVIDQGRGIRKEDQERIFDRFYQVDSSTTRYGDGTGIGLALVHDLTGLLNGNVTVTSDINHGSTFAIQLPITAEAPIANWQMKADLNASLTKTSTIPFVDDKDSPKVLIVEDHEDVRVYLERLLAHRYQIIHADNGKQGLSQAFDFIPDLIISDIMMPEMDGFQFCERIKSDQRSSHIPVILLTAKSTHEDRIEGFEGGADAYLIKPFNEKELLLRISNLLAHQGRLQQYFQKFRMLPQEEVRENKFINQVREHIDANLNNDEHQIDDLAQALHLGRVQLYRKLKALTGKTYTQIIRDMRLQRAKELLEKTDKSVYEIAYDVGYKDGSYFAKVFRKYMGLSAAAFRKKQRSD